MPFTSKLEGVGEENLKVSSTQTRVFCVCGLSPAQTCLGVHFGRSAMGEMSISLPRRPLLLFFYSGRFPVASIIV